MSEKSEKIIEKIRALRKIAESTHSKHERETAIAMAAKLIAEYQVSEADVEAATGKANERDDVTNGSVLYETGRSTAWKAELVWGLSKLNNTYALKFPIRHGSTHRQGSRYRVFGKPSDIEITKYMFDYLVSTISELVDDYVPGGNKRGVNPERESWCLGCVNGFLDKMRVERQKVLALASTSTAMVLVNRQEQIKDAYMKANNVKKLGSVQPSKAQKADTYGSGYRKGQTLTVNPGMGGSSKEPNKLT